MSFPESPLITSFPPSPVIVSLPLPPEISSSKNDISELKWLNSNSTYSLDKGTYDFRIYSDSQADLDSVLVYPLNNYSSSANTNHIKQNQTLDGLFNANDASPQANILEYEKINPTKHILKIENATRPYVLAFAESYDPLWTAYIDSSDGSIKPNDNKDSSFKTNSIALYGVTNGFYVNKKGDYSLVIEYEPQKWYLEGVIISLFSLATILIVALISKKKHLFVIRREK